GVSGTIAMKTNTEVNTKLKGSTGSNFINVDAFVDTPLGEKSSLQISARKAINELVETPTYTSYFDRILQNTEVGNNSTNVINSDIAFDFYDISLRWLYDISKKDQLRINFININNELVFIENANINQNEESKESSLIQNSIAAGLYYQRKWNTKLVSSMQIYETDYKLKAINSDIVQQQKLLQENTVSETSIKFSNWYNYNDQFVFDGGYQFTENGVSNITEIDKPIFKQLKVEVIREHGLFTGANYESKSKKTNVKVGVRYSYIEKFKMHILEPRISVNHKLVDNLRIEILGEMKHQNISQIINFQNDFLGIEKRRWRQSNNKDFPIIMSKQLSLGVNYNK
ncbi:MAG: TonB-dependent receptor, partial [Flavobacterium sp.]|nr:TonB-dependent receptor [Flavobacterium sp.]